MVSTLNLARAYHAAEETRDIQAIVDCFSEDVTWTSGGDVLTGKAALVEQYSGMARAYPGLQVTVTGHAGSEEELAVNWSAILTDPQGEQFLASGVNIIRRSGNKISHLTSVGGAPQPYNPEAAKVGIPKRFAGRSVLVTGAANGIGAAVARRFFEEGASVVGLDLDDDGLRALEGEAKATSGSFEGVAGDLTSEEVVQQGISRATALNGRLDTLVNNAAVFHLGAVGATQFDWDRTLAVNVVAPARITAAAVPALAKSENASVVNVASVSGHVAQAGRWTYGAGKGAILSLTRSQALDLAPHKIRVNSVSPGYIWTDVLDRSAEGDREKWEKIWGEFCMLRRCGEPAEVAAAISFLASEDASFITGNDLLIDGGLASMSPDGQSNFEFSS